MSGFCECVRCDACAGSGLVWFSIGGKYIGQNHCDDTDTSESCEECDGSGISEVCYICSDIEYEDSEL